MTKTPIKQPPHADEFEPVDGSDLSRAS